MAKKQDPALATLSGRNLKEKQAFLRHCRKEGLDPTWWEEIEEPFYAGYRAAKADAKRTKPS